MVIKWLVLKVTVLYLVYLLNSVAIYTGVQGNKCLLAHRQTYIYKKKWPNLWLKTSTYNRTYNKRPTGWQKSPQKPSSLYSPN